MTKSLQMLCCGVVVVWLLAGCKPVTKPESEVGIANPASENCVAVGGTLEIRQGEGGEVRNGRCSVENARPSSERGDGSTFCREERFEKPCKPGRNLSTAIRFLGCSIQTTHRSAIGHSGIFSTDPSAILTCKKPVLLSHNNRW